MQNLYGRIFVALNLYIIELQWCQAPPCFSRDTGGVVLLTFSSGVKNLNPDMVNTQNA